MNCRAMLTLFPGTMTLLSTCQTYGLLDAILETHCRVSNNRGVAKAGSLCMKVARTITQYPIVSSSYCSRTALHSGQRSTMMFSPYLEEEAFLVAFCLDSSSLFLALLPPGFTAASSCNCSLSSGKAFCSSTVINPVFLGFLALNLGWVPFSRLAV